MRARFFYDTAPYDRGYATASESLRIMDPALKALIEAAAGKVILDVGCGCGRNLFHAARHGQPVFGLDYSEESLKIVRERVRLEKLILIRASNLCLPFRDGCADLVISDGVVHHTGDTRAAVTECLRVLKAGGEMYLALYSENRRYRLSYHYIGGPLRFMSRFAPGRVLIEHMLVPLNHHIYRFKKRNRKRGLSRSVTRAVFFDYFLSPIVTFQSRVVVQQWIEAAGCEVLGYDSIKHSHHFIVGKPRTD